jgi:hypothetical protein
MIEIKDLPKALERRRNGPAELLQNIKRELPQLETLLEEISSHWNYEDLMYRFHYQSFKVYEIQSQTEQIVQKLREIAPTDSHLSKFFSEIVADGTGTRFDLSHNGAWTQHTRPLVEAFLHAKYFLEMAVKYGRELDQAPDMMPSGWAALLCLYDIR